MKIILTDEQVNSLIQVEINKRVNEFTAKHNKELLKVQAQLSDALNIVNDLLNNQIAQKKEKLTTERFLELWSSGKSISEIAKLTLYNASYVSLIKRNLIKQGKIVEEKK